MKDMLILFLDLFLSLFVIFFGSLLLGAILYTLLTQ